MIVLSGSCLASQRPAASRHRALYMRMSTAHLGATGERSLAGRPNMFTYAFDMQGLCPTSTSGFHLCEWLGPFWEQPFPPVRMALHRQGHTGRGRQAAPFSAICVWPCMGWAAWSIRPSLRPGGFISGLPARSGTRAAGRCRRRLLLLFHSFHLHRVSTMSGATLLSR